MSFVATPKQLEFFTAVQSGRYSQLVFGGAIGGGKSYLAIALMLAFCRIWPGSRWAIVRKDLPTMRRNTIPTFLKLRPDPFVEQINQSTWTAKCQNGSEIVFFTESIKDDPELNRWRGLEVNGFFLEEMNELQEATYFKGIERAGRWAIPNAIMQPPPLIIGTCNPSKGYVKRLFYDPWKSGALVAPKYYLPSFVTDNPHLTKEYLENLKQMPEAAYETFVKGNWDTADEPDQLIKAEWVEACFARAPSPDKNTRLGVDVARYGDDETVIAEMLGYHLIDLTNFNGIDTVMTASITEKRIIEKQIKTYNVAVDTVGLGAGVADTLYSRHLKIREFVAGAKPVGYHKYLKFKNLRSEAWWNLREMIKDGPMSFSESIRKHTKLIADITTPRYSLDSDKVIEVESKDSIKARIGRSTDYGDALVMAASKNSGAAAYLNAILTQ